MNLRRVKIGLHEKLHRLGFDVVPYSAVYFSNRLRARTIQHLGVTAILDVGANAGQFANGIRSDGWGGLIVSIEPLPSAYAELAQAAHRDPLWSAVNVAAGSTAGSVAFNVSANTWSSSFLPITKRHLGIAPDAHFVGLEQVRVETLDAIVADLQLNRETFFLKADTQGYELEVLAGACATLERTVVVEVELSLIELYEGQPLIADVVRRLVDLGFIPIDFAPNVYADDEIVQINGMFVRNGMAAAPHDRLTIGRGGAQIKRSRRAKSDRRTKFAVMTATQPVMM